MLHAILKKTFISLSALILIACANTPAMHVERKISHAPIPDASTPLAQALSKRNIPMVNRALIPWLMVYKRWRFARA